MTAALLLCAVLLFGTVLGIVIGAHLASTGRIVGHRQDAPAAALNAAPAAAVVAVLREHAELAHVLRELSAAAPPASAASPAAARPADVRQLPAGGDR